VHVSMRLYPAAVKIRGQKKTESMPFSREKMREDLLNSHGGSKTLQEKGRYIRKSWSKKSNITEAAGKCKIQVIELLAQKRWERNLHKNINRLATLIAKSEEERGVKGDQWTCPGDERGMGGRQHGRGISIKKKKVMHKCFSMKAG